MDAKQAALKLPDHCCFTYIYAHIIHQMNTAFLHSHLPGDANAPFFHLMNALISTKCPCKNFNTIQQENLRPKTFANFTNRQQFVKLLVSLQPGAAGSQYYASGSLLINRKILIHEKKKLLIREIFGPQNFLAILSKCNFVPSIMLCGNNFQRNIFLNPPMQIKLHNFHEKKNFITRIGTRLFVLGIKLIMYYGDCG